MVQLLRAASALTAGLAAIALATSAVAAQDGSPFSVGLSAGTDGIGVDLSYHFNPRFGLRLGGSYFKLSHDVNTSSIRYDGRARPETFHLLADVHPFDSAFRLTAGGMLNRNLITLKATPIQATTIGNQTYTPAQLGQINGRVSFRDFAPYAGIGVTTHRDQRGWGFIADAGVMFSGRPRVSLSATGPFASDPTFQSNLALEQQRVADKIDWLRYYPIVKVGVTYRF